MEGATGFHGIVRIAGEAGKGFREAGFVCCDGPEVRWELAGHAGLSAEEGEGDRFLREEAEGDRLSAEVVSAGGAGEASELVGDAFRAVAGNRHSGDEIADFLTGERLALEEVEVAAQAGERIGQLAGRSAHRARGCVHAGLVEEAGFPAEGVGAVDEIEEEGLTGGPWDAGDEDVERAE